MPNDAKLGFLAGVAGVVVAAVLFFQNQPPAAAPASQTPGGPTAATVPPPAATPGRPAPAAGVAVPTGTLTGGGRKEVDAQPVSRTSTDQDE
ncbi:MAG: hypothetical protein JWO38_460 [Gemmataceae bacterium]|nr:hypothetical protein [Gemmataceae bacterium]